jgi:hypothetical protein
MAKHWFVDQGGPWSKAEQQAYQAFHKDIGLELPPESESVPEPESSPEPELSPEASPR